MTQVITLWNLAVAFLHDLRSMYPQSLNAHYSERLADFLSLLGCISNFSSFELLTNLTSLIFQLLQTLSVLPEEHKHIVTDILISQKSAIERSIKESVVSMSTAHLNDFDWQLQV